MAMADNYLMLLDADPACNRSQQRTNFIRTIADDVSLHEQLVLTWPHPSGSSVLKNVSEPFDRLYLKACPGLLVRPSGRYVQRTLPKGLVSFWLLRAVITLQCPPVSIKSDAYYVHIDQWIETNILGMFAESTGSLSAQNDLDSMRPIIYSPQPDRSVRLDCSQSKNYVATYQLMGYVRRVRLSWSFSGALLPPQPNSTSSVKQSKTNTSDLSDAGRSVTPRNVTSWTYPMEPYTAHRLLHPDFGVLIRITSRMLFQGNFSLERKRTLCEFFSGFWCPSSHTGNLTQVAQSDDQEACIQASMRCDKLPDCNPSNSGLSADEISCDMSHFNHSIERQERISNSNQTDRWTSKVPWIVLAPVPLVLVCALVRICSQKRHLEVTDDRDWSRWQDPAGSPSDAVLVDGSGSAENGTKRIKLAKTFWTGKHRRGPQYGPIRTLSSVPEVDERDLDAHSSLNTSQATDYGQPTTEHPKKAGLDGGLVLTDAEGSPKRLKPKEVKARLVKSLSLIPLPDRNDGVFVSDPFACYTENKRRKGPRKTEGPASANHRRFLCWSVVHNPGSSSTSSSQSSSSSSSCSNCRDIDGPSVLRSHSCSDLTNFWPLEYSNAIEMQVLSIKSSVTDEPVEPNNLQIQTKNGINSSHESSSCARRSYAVFADPHNRPTRCDQITQLSKSNGGNASPEMSESSNVVTIVAQIANLPQSSEHQRVDSLGLVIEHPLESNKLLVNQRISGECTTDWHHHALPESLHVDPLDTRSGSRDHLLLFHRSQSLSDNDH